MFPFIYQQYENEKEQLKFPKTDEKSDEIAVTSAVPKIDEKSDEIAVTSVVPRNETLIEIEFPEEKLWHKPSVRIEKFPIFIVSNKPKQQCEKPGMNQIQLKEKRKFEQFAETFAEKSNPVIVTKNKEPIMLQCLDENYGIIKSASKKHRFDEETDIVPDYLATYLSNPSKTNSDIPHSSKEISSTAEVNNKLNNVLMIENKNASNTT